MVSNADLLGLAFKLAPVILKFICIVYLMNARCQVGTDPVEHGLRSGGTTVCLDDDVVLGAVALRHGQYQL